MRVVPLIVIALLTTTCVREVSFEQKAADITLGLWNNKGSEYKRIHELPDTLREMRFSKGKHELEIKRVDLWGRVYVTHYIVLMNDDGEWYCWRRERSEVQMTKGHARVSGIKIP